MNSVKYTIKNKDGVTVGRESQNPMCRRHWGDFMIYEPLEDHTIQPYGFDEDEDETWYGEEQTLLEFLKDSYRGTARLWKEKKWDPEKIIENEFYMGDNAEEKKQMVRDFLKKYFDMEFDK
jgi:hypothetical protein